MGGVSPSADRDDEDPTSAYVAAPSIPGMEVYNDEDPQESNRRLSGSDNQAPQMDEDGDFNFL